MLAAATAAFAAFAHATDMDHKGRVIATAATKNAGTAEVTCNDTSGWKFAVSASQDAGRDVVTVRISSPTNAQPPQFGVFFRVSGAGVQNVWISDFEEEEGICLQSVRRPRFPLTNPGQGLRRTCGNAPEMIKYRR